MGSHDKLPGLSGDEWRETLAAIASHLKNPVSLCLIGSGPGMLSGQPNRVSIDLDSWQKASEFAYSDLKQACEKEGLLFNPKHEVDANQPYIQIVEEGVTQIGDFAETTEILREGRMVVVRPPFENIVASKLVRALPKDIDDTAYIVNTFGITRDEVAKVIRSFPRRARETAEENLIYFEIVAPQKRPPLPSPRGVIAREVAPTGR